jgi:hypothetical protein
MLGRRMGSQCFSILGGVEFFLFTTHTHDDNSLMLLHILMLAAMLARTDLLDRR